MKKWITRVIHLNKYTKWKSYEELIERLSNIKFDEELIDQMIKVCDSKIKEICDFKI